VPPESAVDKARRLLGSGAVRIVGLSGTDVSAIVEGDHRTYTVHRRRGRMTCSCACPGPCSHGRAVDLVTVPAGSWVVAPDLLAIVGGAA
jgi:uncharacterized Zn finger protein